MTTLRNAEERRVLDSCVHGLSDGWFVLPNVVIKASTRDHELDVVLIHQNHGVVDLEVKGHQPEIRQGVWYSRGQKMMPQPPAQAHDNSYVLRDRIRNIEGLGKIKVAYGIALPNVAEVRANLGTDLKRDQILTAESMNDMADAVTRLAFTVVDTVQLDAEDVAEIIEMLRPDVSFDPQPNAQAEFSRHRLDAICRSQVGAVETLDRNKRVLVLGAAGTGKTRLAEQWVRRAIFDDQDVLFTCYNEPLAAQVIEDLPFEELTAGPFLRLALSLLGMEPLPIPEDAGHDWWTNVVPAHLREHWSKVTERYDTIVVDEGQDFSPEWLEMLEGLLNEGGRLLVVADPAQELYVRGFEVPDDDSGWTTCELVMNCRNAQQIARILRRRLNGAAAPAVAPEALSERFQPVPHSDVEAVIETVRDELQWLLEDEGRDPSRIAILTFSSALRDSLLNIETLVRWENRGDGLVVCENVHRVKGMEFDTVVLVADQEVPDGLLYVGVSRAISELSVVAPKVVGDRLGIS
ncbi:MAG: AAA family ATPase [Acidimicrobiales bacterium]|nr:AAA family ATPase [Acidimicrobiales bacterium]